MAVTNRNQRVENKHAVFGFASPACASPGVWGDPAWVRALESCSLLWWDAGSSSGQCYRSQPSWPVLPSSDLMPGTWRVFRTFLGGRKERRGRNGAFVGWIKPLSVFRWHQTIPFVGWASGAFGSELSRLRLVCCPSRPLDLFMVAAFRYLGFLFPSWKHFAQLSLL